MKIIFAALGLVLFSVGLVQAQKNPVKRRAVALSVGWQKVKLLDEHLSPLKYSSNRVFPKIGVSYSRQTSRAAWDIEASVANGRINPSRFGARNYKVKWSDKDSFQYSINSPFYNADIKASYFRNISSLSSTYANYWLGGTVNESAFLGEEMVSMPWLLNSFDVSPAGRVNYGPSFDHNIGIAIDFAAVGLLSRATYGFFAKSNKDKNITAFLKQGTRVALPNRYRKGSINFIYWYQVSQKFAVGSAYKLKWIYYNYPKPLRVADKTLDFKFLYTY